MNYQSDYGYSTGAVSMRCRACGSSELNCCDGRGNPVIRLKGCFQDGETFYREGLIDDDADLREHGEDFIIATYPGMVRGDHDMNGAVRARRRFAKEHPEFVEG